MNPTNEDLLALADRLDGIEIYSVREHLSGLGTRPIEAANNAVCEAAAALRAIVAERQGRTRIGGDASVAVCPICDIAGCYHIRAAALDVSETPESERQTDLLSESERQAIRDKALDDAAQCCADEADRCDDAVKWGGHRSYVQDCKAAAYAMRDRANAIRKMKGTKG